MCMQAYVEEKLMGRIKFYIENNLKEEFGEVAD